MKYNDKDGIFYMTAAEFAADTEIKALETAKVYVYETGKLYVTDGNTWHEFGIANA